MAIFSAIFNWFPYFRQLRGRQFYAAGVFFVVCFNTVKRHESGREGEINSLIMSLLCIAA
jgi:hypothetical protein